MGYNKGKSKEYYFNDTRRILEKEGYTILSSVDDYLNSQSKLEVICPNNHRINVNRNGVQQGARCITCHHDSLREVDVKYTESHVIDILSKESYSLVNKFRDDKGLHRMTITCPNNHTYETYINNFSRGYRCKECQGLKKYTYEEVKEYINSRGYILLSEAYERAHGKLEIQCNNGHKYKASFKTFKDGNRCRKCSSSKGQHLVRYILNGLLVDRIFKEEHSVRIDESSHRFDFFIEPNIFIEYDGIQHFNVRSHFDGEEGFRERIHRDSIKDNYVKEIGGHILRVPYTLTHEEVLTTVYNFLKGKVPVIGSFELEGYEYMTEFKNYRDIADYYVTHSTKETMSKFSISNSHVSVCFKKIYGITKTEYLRTEVRK